MREIDRWGQLRLSVQFPDAITLHHADEQARRENASYAGSINFLPRLTRRPSAPCNSARDADDSLYAPHRAGSGWSRAALCFRPEVQHSRALVDRATLIQYART